MLIIPAIDLKDGVVVRLTQGNKDTATVYSNDPVEVAKLWEAQGAELIHVVDLDGAMLGKPQNLEVVKKIIKAINIPIEFGGGVRNIKTVEEILNMGVNKVIIGSKAAIDPNLIRNVMAKFKDKVIIGIDAKGGRVAIWGWQQMTEYSAIDLAQEMKRSGVTEIIYTDIAKDGMLEGPNFEAIKDFIQSVKVNVIASGGITTLDDVKKLIEFKGLGLKGMIIGKALYTGRIDLKEAIKIAKEAPEIKRREEEPRFKKPFRLRSDDDVIRLYP
jgi:phosphoribosylformimino-5-aminoimidazole carboxamide ribotide isomerase